MFNPKNLQDAYSLAKLQDSLKTGPHIPATVESKGNTIKFYGSQSYGDASKAIVTGVANSGGYI